VVQIRRETMDIPKSNAKLSDIAKFYLVSENYRRLKAGSQNDYAKHLSAAIATTVDGKALGSYRIDKLKVRVVTAAYQKWAKTGTRNANYRKSVLSAAWRYAMSQDVMENNPVAFVETYSTNQRTVTWDRDYIRRFLNVAYGDMQYRSIGLIVHMAYDWGQRVGDMRLLKWHNLNLEQCRLDLNQSKRNADVKLPISEGLCNMLKNQKEDFGFQEFVAPRTKPRAGAFPPYNKDEIAPIINQILTKAELPMELTAMDLRRTAVTEMLEGGADMAGIRQVTGHKNIQSVTPYMVNTLSGATKALTTRGNDDEGK
jgi:integrase